MIFLSLAFFDPSGDSLRAQRWGGPFFDFVRKYVKRPDGESQAKSDRAWSGSQKCRASPDRSQSAIAE